MLGQVKRLAWRKYIIPFLSKRNWRPSRHVAIDEMLMHAKFGFDEEELVKAHLASVRDSTMSSFERLVTLWQQVRYLDRYDIRGSLVECGVWKGGSAAIMALAHLHGGGTATREIHLFDSFQGLPEPDREMDGPMAVRMADGRGDGKLVPIGYCVASLDDCMRLLVDRIGYPSELIKVHGGWFEETVPAAADQMADIALLRLDGDWYRSTKLCLDNLYGRVSANGVVVIDDYGHFAGCRKAVNEFLGELSDPVLLNHIDYTARYWVKAPPRVAA